MGTPKIFSNANSLLEWAKNNGLEIAAPIDVDKIASLLGIAVNYDASLHESGTVGKIQFSNGYPVVTINPLENTYEPRRRFTLAHEIGHYCLHSNEAREGFTDNRRTMSRNDSYWDRFESEANSFAAQLLMPKLLLIEVGNRIIKEYQDTQGIEHGMPVSTFTEKMADIFDVSNKAMEYRLKNLGLVN